MSSLAPGKPLEIETHKLCKSFGDHVVVDHLDLSIPKGSVFGLLGSNGAGKSTTIRMLSTLLPPTAGSAKVAGFDVARAPLEVRRRIGYVPQLLSADAGLTGQENLMLSAKLHGIPRAERGPRIAESLAFMGLTSSADALVKTYSGGMIRRLEIAQSMLHRPRVLFLDEPTVGLDPVARRAVWEKLLSLVSERETTVLLTTHDMEEADELCDQIGLMHTGKLEIEGTPEELRASVGEGATLEDVFAHYTGGSLEQGGNYRDVARTRRTAERLG